MENIFKIVERKRNHWEEHKYNSNKDKYRICTYIHYYDNETVPFYIGQGTLNIAFNMNRYERTNNINKKEIACFSLDGKHIKTFENIKQAAYEYFTSVSIISKCIKNNKPFRGIIYWKRI